VHAAAVVAEHGLGHERHSQVVLVGQVEQDVFRQDRLVGAPEQTVEHHLDFLLSPLAHLMVVVLDVDAQLQQHAGGRVAKIVIQILGIASVVRVVVEFLARVNVVERGADPGVILHLRENVEFVLRPPIRTIGHAALDEQVFRFFGDPPRILRKSGAL